MSKDTRLHVLLTQPERVAFKQLAAELGMSMSALARLAIRVVLKGGLVIPGAKR